FGLCHNLCIHILKMQLKIQFAIPFENSPENPSIQIWVFTDGWIYYQFSLYYVSNETKNWTESRRYCTERGTDLVIINNKEEQDFVKKISRGTQTWIGLSDIFEESKWKWVDGSALNFRFWLVDEPRGKMVENCVVTHVGWVDYPCTSVFKWISEKINIK
uniref:C-type lectin domain-containing protein n=1 Tax=Cyprinus carpio TaxID=7962 RepID=A0A8C1M091_CYPCA